MSTLVAVLVRTCWVTLVKTLANSRSVSRSAQVTVEDSRLGVSVSRRGFAFLSTALLHSNF